MTPKKGFTLGEFRSATKEVDDTVALYSNGQAVTDVLLQRDDEGVLQVNQLAEMQPADPPVDPPAPVPDEVAAAETGQLATTDDDDDTEGVPL